MPFLRPRGPKYLYQFFKVNMLLDLEKLIYIFFGTTGSQKWNFTVIVFYLFKCLPTKTKRLANVRKKIVKKFQKLAM